MASPAAVDAPRRVHVFHHREVRAAGPFVVGRMMRTRMAAAANLPSQFRARPHRDVVRIGRMKRRRAVAVLALHPGEIGCRTFRDEPCGQSVPNRVARKTARVLVHPCRLEGFERGGEGEFARFLTIAKGSSGELRSQLYVAVDAGYIDGTTFNGLYANAEEVSRIIGGLHAAVVRKRDEQ